MFRVNFCLKETATSDAISRFIKHWFEIENYTKRRYALLADRTDYAQAKALFNQLSSAGDRHAKILQRIREILTETGEIDKEVTLNIRIRILEEGKPKRWGTAIEETYHGMKDHLEPVSYTHLTLPTKASNIQRDAQIAISLGCYVEVYWMIAGSTLFKPFFSYRLLCLSTILSVPFRHLALPRRI